MGRRWGKTTLCGSVGLTCAWFGGQVAWLTPTYRNSHPLWRFAERHCRPLDGAIHIQRADRMIEMPSGGSLALFTDENADGMRGWDFDLVIVDEAATVREETVRDVIEPTLADRDGIAFYIGTPKGRNWFWREWRAAYSDGRYAAAFRAPTAANPLPTIRRAADRIRERFGDESVTYRQEWLAEFVEESAATYSRQWWEDGRNRFDAGDPAFRNRSIARWISWDTGLKDKDTNAYSAGVVLEMQPDYRVLVRDVRRERLTFPYLVPAIEEFAAKHNADGKLRGVLIEDKASGTSAIQTLRQSGPEWLRPLVLPFTPSGDKRQRGEQAAVWCRLGCVWLPHPSPAVRWLLPFEQELYEAPGSEFMDQCDGLAQGLLYLEHMLAAGHHARSSGTGESADVA